MTYILSHSDSAYIIKEFACHGANANSREVYNEVRLRCIPYALGVVCRVEKFRTAGNNSVFSNGPIVGNTPKMCNHCRINFMVHMSVWGVEVVAVQTNPTVSCLLCTRRSSALTTTTAAAATATTFIANDDESLLCSFHEST